jgi:hypothetical protein
VELAHQPTFQQADVIGRLKMKAYTDVITLDEKWMTSKAF